MTAEVSFHNTLIQYHGNDVPDNGLEPYLNVRFPETFHLINEEDRLKTFQNWPNKQIDPKKLAAAGFFYKGQADIVQCYSCGIKGHNWLENDNPMDDHMKWNKNCNFVRQNTTSERNNTSTTQSPPTAQSQPPPSATNRQGNGRDICGNLNVEIHPFSETEDSSQTDQTASNTATTAAVATNTSTSTNNSANLERLNVYKATGPSHPDQITYETRLSTFENWPISIKQKPAELANAGFYYLGVGDQTLCFYCGGGLKDWVPEDDPWEQHAKWFPKCNYLLLKKTPAYVESVQKKKQASESKSSATVETVEKQDEQLEEKPCSSNNLSGTKEKEEEKTDENSTGLCKICYKNEVGIVFVPCGHIVACVDCGPPLKECPVCRKQIELIMRGFLS